MLLFVVPVWGEVPNGEKAWYPGQIVFQNPWEEKPAMNENQNPPPCLPLVIQRP